MDREVPRDSDCERRRHWCGRRDSNPHDFRHRNLNPARLPVPPRPQWRKRRPAAEVTPAGCALYSTDAAARQQKNGDGVPPPSPPAAVMAQRGPPSANEAVACRAAPVTSASRRARLTVAWAVPAHARRRAPWRSADRRSLPSPAPARAAAAAGRGAADRAAGGQALPWSSSSRAGDDRSGPRRARARPGDAPAQGRGLPGPARQRTRPSRSPCTGTACASSTTWTAWPGSPQDPVAPGAAPATSASRRPTPAPSSTGRWRPGLVRRADGARRSPASAVVEDAGCPSTRPRRRRRRLAARARTGAIAPFGQPEERAGRRPARHHAHRQRRARAVRVRPPPGRARPPAPRQSVQRAASCASASTA